MTRKNVILDKDDVDMLNEIEQHAGMFGSDVFVVRAVQHEECEREIQHEREVEKEVHRQIPQRSARTPAVWNIDQLLHSASPKMLPPEAGVQEIAQAIKSVHSASQLRHISWARTNIFVTANFIQTVDSDYEGVNNLSDYLRPVDPVVLYKYCGELLLVSDHEAGHLLKKLWGCTEAELDELPISLLSFASLLKHNQHTSEPNNNIETAPSQDDAIDPELDETDESECVTKLKNSWMCIPPIKSLELEPVVEKKLLRSLIGLKLFPGETLFSETEKETLSKVLLRRVKAKIGALKMVEIRGRQDRIARSDLDAVCRLGSWSRAES